MQQETTIRFVNKPTAIKMVGVSRPTFDKYVKQGLFIPSVNPLTKKQWFDPEQINAALVSLMTPQTATKPASDSDQPKQ